MSKTIAAGTDLRVTLGHVTPEAPRTIFDALGAINRLALQLQARAGYEQVDESRWAMDLFLCL